jgi:cysteinyl-tRNA synthetase
MLLTVHYRSVMDFSDDTLDGALTGLHRIYEAKLKAKEIMKQARARADMRAEAAWGSFAATCEATRREIDDAYANDLNTPGAMGGLFSLIREFNRTVAEPLASATPSAVIGAEQLIQIIEQEIGSVIGIGRQDPTHALEDIQRMRAAKAQGAPGANVISEEEIGKLINERLEARKAKNFARADEIRKELDSRGVIIKDGPTGTSWQYK